MKYRTLISMTHDREDCAPSGDKKLNDESRDVVHNIVAQVERMSIRIRH